nr:hypothetical protein [Candidatus Njordarchaeum guaymaensis]
MSASQGVVKLGFKEKGFVEGLADADIVLMVDVQEKKLTLKSNPGANFIDVRTAERQARSFPKVGINLKNGFKVGQGFELVIENDVGPPERLRHSPRQVYVSDYKEQ